MPRDADCDTAVTDRAQAALQATARGRELTGWRREFGSCLSAGL
ncbi:hypothetical protein [Streptomyces sp. NPDC058457]